MGWLKNLFRLKKQNTTEYLKIDKKTIKAVTKNPEGEIIQTTIMECFPMRK